MKGDKIMNKEELIKILRSSSNDIKTLLKNQEQLKEQLCEIISKDKNLVDKNRFSFPAALFSALYFINSITLSILIKDDISNIVRRFFYEGFSILILIGCCKQYKTLKMDELSYNQCVQKIKNSEREILSSEHAIEFLNSITEEELNKYLSYKM